MTFILINSNNPDVKSITNKEIIDISYTNKDIYLASSSFTEESVIVNDSLEQITIVTPRYDNVPVTDGRIYFTPLYTEQIDYQTWVTTVNKNFFELT